MLDLKESGRVAQLVEQCPFKAWVAGSSPAALTKISRYLEDFGRVDFGHPRTPRTVSTKLVQRFALSISREISPAAHLDDLPVSFLLVGGNRLCDRVPRLSWAGAVIWMRSPIEKLRISSRKTETPCCRRGS